VDGARAGELEAIQVGGANAGIRFSPKMKMNSRARAGS